MLRNSWLLLPFLIACTTPTTIEVDDPASAEEEEEIVEKKTKPKAKEKTPAKKPSTSTKPSPTPEPAPKPTPTAEKADPKAIFGNLYASLKTTCGSCHTTGPGPSFLGADEAAGYATFKADFNTPNARILTKGEHEGPELMIEQASMINTWQAAEKGVNLCQCTAPGKPIPECPEDEPQGCP